MATKAKSKPGAKKLRKPKAGAVKKPNKVREKSARGTKPARSFKRFMVRFILAFVFLIFAIPAVLLMVYRFEVVHPVSTLMVRESIIGHGAKREWIDIDDMAPVIYQSVLSSEDGKFCSHSGVDWDALNKVIEDAIDGEKNPRCQYHHHAIGEEFVPMA